MSNMENKHFRDIDKILWKDWDPIDVNDLEMCRDEYRSYVPEIYTLATTGRGQAEIASKLFEIAQNEMGIILPMELCRKVAKKIINVG
jgi:hypothetical protein